MNEKQVGVLGATSLAGECILRQLIQNGWHVNAFSRYAIAHHHPQMTWRQINLPHPTDPDNNDNPIPYWLCAAPIWVLPGYFDLLLTYGAQRVVVLSSTSRFTKEISSDPLEKKIVQRLIDSEDKVKAWATAHKIDWIILRPTLIYGYGRDKNISEIAQVIRRFGFFPLFGPAQGLRQPIHVEDVALACCRALDTLNLANRSYNLTGGEVLTFREMVRRVFEAQNLPPRMLTVPLWFFKMALWGLKRLPRYRHWTPAMAERMNQDLKFDCSEAQRDLNIVPRPFKLMATDLPRQLKQ
ncbi:NAD-dependent epimerase/dehydratase family protein [Nitrosomonas sp.]|uniref:NAD-dependent epimerase/dehydratase family protein n=1 Tax=Nitrosomonas sp. TaxID=42353 RepID=UPI001D718D3F|nr:NAD-dependent epimerase/dehydratase family protein [Nitrosomonas sp.]MBX3615829.1 NAD-dependent epimerase/dehydratase family protein [Nitrosomonas sp.]